VTVQRKRESTWDPAASLPAWTVGEDEAQQPQAVYENTVQHVAPAQKPKQESYSFSFSNYPAKNSYFSQSDSEVEDQLEIEEIEEEQPKAEERTSARQQKRRRKRNRGGLKKQQQPQQGTQYGQFESRKNN